MVLVLLEYDWFLVLCGLFDFSVLVCLIVLVLVFGVFTIKL